MISKIEFYPPLSKNPNAIKKAVLLSVRQTDDNYFSNLLMWSV